jgi:hypothetical protein
VGVVFVAVNSPARGARRTVFAEALLPIVCCGPNIAELVQAQNSGDDSPDWKLPSRKIQQMFPLRLGGNLITT